MQKKKAISLIVLVITIIIMIILAGAIILTLSNSGIINKASEAVDKTDEANVKHLASLAWAEAYTGGLREQEDLEEYVLNKLTQAGIKTEDYTITVTTKGVEVVSKGNDAKWVKEGFTVVKGNQVLEIGDIVNYDETAGGTKTGLTATEWKVLGADEDGNLLLMSTADVKEGYEFGDDSESNLAECQNDWLNGAAELDSICEPYGYGNGVVGKARSITVEDVDAVTGYDKTTYGKGQLGQYGNVVTYKYNETTKPACESVVTSKTLTFEHSNGFYYYDGKEFKHITDLTIGTSGNVFATLTSDFYYYSALELTTINSEINEKAFEMIFGEYDEETGKYSTYCWLASPYVYINTYCVYFGLRTIYDGCVGGSSLFYSYGGHVHDGQDIRVVVALSSELQLVGSSAEGWSY